MDERPNPIDPAQVTPEVTAIRAHVGARIVRLVDFTKRDAGGTAVKVQIGKRFFLATASHVIPDSHDIRALIPGAEDGFVTSFQQRLRDDSCDVGLLELAPEDAEFLGGAFVSADEISVGFEHSPSPVIVAGYPGQLIDSSDQQILSNAVALVHDFRSLVFLRTHFRLRAGPPIWSGLQQRLPTYLPASIPNCG